MGVATGVATGVTFTVSHPEKVESRARCLNRGNWTLRVQKRCFWDISTPSSGQNWRKTRFFAFFGVFFAFFLIEIHQNIFDLGHGNKKCLGIIFRHFMFSLLNIFSLKIFHDGPQDWKHGKFKSKKQSFTNFNAYLLEAYVWTPKAPQKIWAHLSQKWPRNGHLKVFSSRWFNFAALWWPKYAFVGIFDCVFSISAKNWSIRYTNLKN